MLDIIGNLKVPNSVYRHRHYLEAKALSRVMGRGKNSDHGGVVGTENNSRAELYAWHNPVRTHIDSTESDCWIYGLILKPGRNLSLGMINPDTGAIHMERPEQGDIYRLNDRYPHWTEGTGGSVAIFVGCYPAPNDEKAVQLLERGLNRLANGVYQAPRASLGYRIMLDDECLATNDFSNAHMVRRELAEKRGWLIQECGLCDKPASKLDNHWPYHQEMNRCLDHRREGSHA